MHRTIICGSPRDEGRSAHLAQEIFEACIEDCPHDGVSLVALSALDVAGCKGCDACQNACSEDSEGSLFLPEEGDPLYPQHVVLKSDAMRHVCIMKDDMREVRKHLDAADEVIVVCPVYFAGPPSQMKALLDRLQPYYWSNVRTQGRKRPLTLHVVGEGGDPHGIDPLIGCVRSAFAIAGFKVETVFDWRGRINEDGAIVEDAKVYGG